MNKRKLELYEDLFKKAGPGLSNVHIGDIASAFHCSERHARTLLKQMSANQWLTWSPMKGRGQKGQLICLLEPLTACFQAVDQAIVQERYDLAHQLIGFHGRSIASNLKRYLARTAHKSENTIYAPFHRKLDWLHPHHVTGRTERHLIHEVFQTLVSNNGQSFSANLAHHWESETGDTCWRFHLSPAAVFHDQTPVTSDDVVSSINTLVTSAHWGRLYDHIISISAVTPHCLEIHLNTPDPNLPSLLSRAEASIMPKRYVCADRTAFSPVGSGPFSVDVNSDKLFRLNRNEHYCGQSALVEHIEIWIHEEWASDKKCEENFFFLESGEQNYQISTKEIGYFFILFNHQGLQDESTKQAFVDLFRNAATTDLDLRFPVTFSFENNNESRHFAAKLTAAFSRLGNSVSANQISFGRTLAKQDLTLGGIRIEGDKSACLYAFFKLYPYWQHCMTWRQHEHLNQTLQSVRQSTCSQEREALLNQLIADLTEDNILSILSSEDLTLTVPSRVEGVDINGLGWCDFSKLWIKPSF
ncbi:SgrR family transcriptional regulator [Vibrio jasicida]|uniref:SgrR family transcriptional regulator n=1 Tax=Vibrio jasicida TaxID=766224 RepID=A0ABW7J586_9VIBR